MPNELNDYVLQTEPDPLRWFHLWYEEQRTGAATKPYNAMILATVDPDGAPDARVVLLTQWDEGGFVFMSNYESSKGVQLAANPMAALVFHWPEHGRQVRVRGPVTQTGAALSDAYFLSRPRSSQLGAWASLQSQPLLGGSVELNERVAQQAAAHAGSDVPRPPHWGGYRLMPQTLELWQTAPARLHVRYRFSRDGPGDAWTCDRLHP